MPFALGDDDLNDEWECKDNTWDKTRASCNVPQELSNEEIDEILAMQVGAPCRPMCHAAHHATRMVIPLCYILALFKEHMNQGSGIIEPIKQ